MGAAMGVPSLPTDAINRTAEEVTTTFAPKYTKQYSLKLVEQIEKDKTATKPNKYLQSPPPASEPLKSGYLVKQGGSRKNWKKRFFVALNEADNFDVLYYVDEAASKGKDAKPKGRICLCWYRVKTGAEGSEGASAEAGEANTITLAPYWSSDRRRTWYIRCESAEVAKAWADVFQIACNKAHAPVNPDPVAASAFNLAFRDTRWALGEWGWWYAAATESGQLAQLISQRCERDCMVPVYEGVPAALRETARGKLRGMLDTTVGAAVEAAWKSVSASIEKSAPALRVKVEESIGPVIDKKVEMKGKVANSISGVLNPAVSLAASKIVPKVAGVLLDSLLTAQTTAINIFITEMTKLVGAASATASGAGAAPADGADIKKGIAEFTRETYWYWGVLHDAIVPIRDFGNKKLKTTASVAGKNVSIPVEELVSLLHGVDIWTVARDFEDSVRAEARRAAYTFGKLLEEQPGADKATILAKVVAMYVHDSKVFAYEQVHKVFLTVLLSPIHKEITPSIQGALEPIKALIPEALSGLLDLDGTVEQVIEDAIGNVVDTTVIPETASFFSGLDAVVAKAGPADITVPDFRTTLSSGLVAFA